MRNILPPWLSLLAFALVLALPMPAAAQSGGQPFGKEKLDQLTAPIALYPDSLLSQVLMASTYPDDVAAAAKWSRANSEQKGDEAVKLVESQPWDPSVQSLVAFPQVIIMMGEKPDWVRDLGDAFLDQPEDVMDSVQRLRAQAQKAGNLSTNSEVKVTTETVTKEQTGAPAQVIVVEPAQPQTVYVPTYNPAYVYGPWPYPAYPPYYIPPPPGYWFSAAVATGIAWGIGIGISNALWGGCNWGRGDVNINVNRYNNINTNNRINANGNSKWNHNTAKRGNTPYRGGDATRQNLDRKAQAGSREQYRGRDAERARASESMQNRGMDVDRSVANRAPGGADRTPGAAGGDRGQNAARDRAQTADHNAMRQNSQAMNRDNALRGANDGNARAEMNRGQSSYQSAQRDMQRPSGGASSRPSGGGGGARAGGGAGGGGGRAGGGGGGRGGGGGGRR